MGAMRYSKTSANMILGKRLACNGIGSAMSTQGVSVLFLHREKVQAKVQATSSYFSRNLSEEKNRIG